MVAAWTWVLVYVVGFVLFQVLLYRYLQRSDTSFEQAAPDYGDGESASRRLASAPTDEDRDGVRCRHCGTYNESEFTYCRECTQPFDATP